MIRVSQEIVTPADDFDLVTLPIVKDELKIDPSNTEDDAFLQRTISDVSLLIQRYVGRTLVVETIKDTMSFDAGSSRPTIRTSRWPIITIGSLSDGDVSLSSPGDYIVELSSGILSRVSPSLWTGPLIVQYDAGYATVPPDIVGVSLRVITSRFRSRGRDPLVRTQDQPGLGQQTFWIGEVPGASGPFPGELASVLDSYRMPVMA